MSGAQDRVVVKNLIKEISGLRKYSTEDTIKILQKHKLSDGSLPSKSLLYLAYEKLTKSGQIHLTKHEKERFLNNIRKKTIRTISGVTPVTVLTKPYPCPGRCIFCPNDVRMPKSYLEKEPGAQRAAANRFDPYFQTFNRLVAIKNIGHPTDKVEIIILGGTWSGYPEKYQIWFVKRCFDALNEFSQYKGTNTIKVRTRHPYEESLLQEVDGKNIRKTYNEVTARALRNDNNLVENASWQELFLSQRINEAVASRCVGLAVETRPDEITPKELIKIRKLGGTKIQIGIQSLSNRVLRLNKRGHQIKDTKQAFELMRSAGFKIHAHWMPNLYGSKPNRDIEDFKKIFSDKYLKPDELKIYPCSLLASAELMKYYKNGKWHPYTNRELARVLDQAFKNVPRFCRITRVIRDIPGSYIVAGNRKTNFRQIVENDLAKKGIRSKDIRAREIRGREVSIKDLCPKQTKYETSNTWEYFLEYVTENDDVAAFLRLSLPKKTSIINELKGSALVRELHVYGQSLKFGTQSPGKAQHIGLGRKLLIEAEKIVKDLGFAKISVISSVGTRSYYEKNGYAKVNIEGNIFYQHKILSHETFSKRRKQN